MHEVPRAVLRVAAFGIRDDHPDDPVDVSDVGWSGFLEQVALQRLTGLAVAAVEGGALRLSEVQEAELLEAQRESMMLALTLESRLLDLAPALETRGIRYAVLKGPAVAHSCYPDPSWRPFGDLDILVRRRDLLRASRVLAELGYRRAYPEPRRGFVERFGNTVLHRDRSDVEVDLHHTLIAGPFGQWIDADRLFEGLVTFPLGGRAIPRLTDTALLLHSVIHASLGHRPPLLLPVRDVAQVLRTSSVDPGLLAQWVRDWHLRGVMAHAFDQAERLTGVRPDRSVRALCDRPAVGRDRWGLEAYATARRDRGGRALATLRAIRGIGAKVAFARALLFPGGEFMTARMGVPGAAGYVRRWMIPLRWLAERTRSGHVAPTHEAEPGGVCRRGYGIRPSGWAHSTRD
jgi:hypothetical protein